MSDKVKWVSPTPGELADGRPMGPGDVAEKVDLKDPHNDDLLASGRIAVVGAVQPSDVPKDELAESEESRPPAAAPAPAHEASKKRGS